MTKIILVTGATGYIASKLIPQLLERGHTVRALARRQQPLRARKWFDQIEVVQADVMDPASLAPALKNIHTAYYLIHNMTSGYGYIQRELKGARNFARAAEEAGIKHIIYLGGLADPQQHIASHLRSRIETGMALRQGKVPVTEFRAGVIAGSGSISFEMIRFMTELFPIIPGPRGLKNKTQPISTQNVVDYLLAALGNPNSRGRIFEIGGPRTVTYQDLMFLYAKIRGHERRFFLFPYIPNWFMAFGIGLMTPVPYPIAYALVAGLSSDSLVRHDEAREVFHEIELVDFESAAGEALTRLHPQQIEHIWQDGQTALKVLKHEGFFIDHRQIQVSAAPEKVFEVIKNMGGKEGWPFANWLWQLRGRMNGSPLLSGRVPVRVEGLGVREKLQVGDQIDYYIVDSIEPGHLLLHSRLIAPGQGWLEWRVLSNEKGARLAQTAYFAPRGPGGFLYWVLLYPIHAFVLRGLIRAIANRSNGSS